MTDAPREHGTRPPHSLEGPETAVVIPTRGREAALARCLRALEDQSIHPALRVIVVYDGGAPGALDVGRATLVETGAARGPAAARNAGARAAATPYLLFTDDDCVPDRSWAERLVARLRAGADVVAGTTVVAPHDRLGAASQVIVDHLMLPERDAVSLTFAPTMNVGCRAVVAADCPFDETFGAAAGEDRAWSLAVRGRGYRITPVPEARVEHRPDLTVASFMRQHLRYGRGSRQYRARYGAPLESHGFYVRLLRRAFAQGLDVGLFVTAAQAATAAGVASARLASIRGR